MRIARTRTTVAVVAAALAAWAMFDETGAAAFRLTLTAQPEVPFPVRVYAFSFPGRSPAVIRVTENGRPVPANVTPIGEKRVPYSAAVLLDTSLTMGGGPLVGAREAATTLIEGKAPRAELALWGFYSIPYLLSNWSTDKPLLQSSLAALHTRYGTALWDSVILASERLRSRQGSAKAIVVLTDGQIDTTHTSSVSAIDAAKRAGARVFVVIAGPGYAPQVARLEHVAAATGGAVVRVRSIADLRARFADLARTLSRQYLLSYVSPIAGGRSVRVDVTMDSARASVDYVTPHASSTAPGASFLFTTTGTALFVMLIVGLPVALGVSVVVMRGRLRYRD